MPRPTRTLRCREPRGGFKFDRFTAMLSSFRFLSTIRWPPEAQEIQREASSAGSSV
jgi:hypothetical protein